MPTRHWSLPNPTQCSPHPWKVHKWHTLHLFANHCNNATYKSPNSLPLLLWYNFIHQHIHELCSFFRIDYFEPLFTLRGGCASSTGMGNNQSGRPVAAGAAIRCTQLPGSWTDCYEARGALFVQTKVSLTTHPPSLTIRMHPRFYQSFKQWGGSKITRQCAKQLKVQTLVLKTSLV